MRYNSQCILVFSSTTIIPKKRAHARFCVIETVFLNYLFVTAPYYVVITIVVKYLCNQDNPFLQHQHKLYKHLQVYCIVLFQLCMFYID